MKKLLFLISLFTLTLSAQDYYIHAGKMFDSKEGKMLDKMTIIVSGTEIKGVKKGFEIPDSDNIIIDLKDSTVMPGFIDLHVHMESEYNPEK